MGGHRGRSGRTGAVLRGSASVDQGHGRGCDVRSGVARSAWLAEGPQGVYGSGQMGTAWQPAADHRTDTRPERKCRKRRGQTGGRGVREVPGVPGFLAACCASWLRRQRERQTRPEENVEPLGALGTGAATGDLCNQRRCFSKTGLAGHARTLLRLVLISPRTPLALSGITIACNLRICA